MTPVWAVKLARLCEKLVRDSDTSVGWPKVVVDLPVLEEIERVLKNRKSGHTRKEK